MTASKWRYFTVEELSCNCGCGLGQDDMQPRFMRRLIELRTDCDFAFPVTSAARCSEYNAKVSSTGAHGPHTPMLVDPEDPKRWCHAVDIQVYGHEASKLIARARQFGFTGIGVKQNGPHGARFIHLDDLPNGLSGPRPWIWSY